MMVAWTFTHLDHHSITDFFTSQESQFMYERLVCEL